LHPDTLLVPVHFRVFADSNGLIAPTTHQAATEWLNEDFVRSIFDPGLVTEAVTTVNNPHSSSTFVATMRRPRAFAPDDAFAACGVQFRLASFRVIRQAEGIESAAFESCSTRAVDVAPVLTSRSVLSRLVAQERESYLAPGAISVNDTVGVDVYVTGLLRGRDLPRSVCSPEHTGAGFYFATGGRNNPVWISNEWQWFGWSSVIAHELGHKLIGSDDHVFEASNVMSTGPSPNNTNEEKTFNVDQCRSIRRRTASRLFNSGVITQERYDEVLAE
jgi:hypothetical protein